MKLDQVKTLEKLRKEENKSPKENMKKKSSLSKKEELKDSLLTPIGSQFSAPTPSIDLLKDNDKVKINIRKRYRNEKKIQANHLRNNRNL